MYTINASFTRCCVRVCVQGGLPDLQRWENEALDGGNDCEVGEEVLLCTYLPCCP